MAERVALAPDWLFGRGCLKAVREPLKLMRAAGATGTVRAMEIEIAISPRDRDLTAA